MEDFFEDKRIIVACAIGIAVVLVISITSIVLIWRNNLGISSNVPENNVLIDNSNIDTGIGKYSRINATRESQIRIYMLDIITRIQSGDINQVYEKLDPEYIEYFKLSKSSFEQKLNGKMILGKKLNMSKYKYSSLNGRAVYIVDYSSIDSYISGKINIIERSPNNYTIAFDDFIAYEKEPKVLVKDGLSFTISDQAWFNSKYILKAKLKNLNDTSYIVNSEKLYENNYLVLATGVEVRTMSSVVAGDSVELKKDAEMNYSLEFNISELSFGSIDSFLIKGIKSSTTGISQDYKFKVK